MPKGRRPAIDYTPQFGGGIFRPKNVVADELATLEREEEAAASSESSTQEQERTVEITNERMNERTNERNRVRHSFDVWQDQLLALAEIQAYRFTRTGRKPKLGELVQEALDTYIASHRERTNVRTNERPDK